MAASQGFFSELTSSGMHSTNPAFTYEITYQLNNTTGLATLAALSSGGSQAQMTMDPDPNGDITFILDGSGAVVIPNVVISAGTVILTQLDVDNIRLDGNDISTTNTNGDLTLTPNGTGIISSTTATAGVTRGLTISNTDNSNTASNANVTTSVGGTSGGDAYHLFAIGASRSYAVGPDTSASQILKINTDASGAVTPSSGTNLWSMTSAGVQTLPLQPMVFAYVSSTIANVTGDGTTYTVIWDAEDFDQSGSFNTGTGTFTAPVAGKYYFHTTLLYSGLLVTHTSHLMQINTTSRNIQGAYCNPFTSSFSTLFNASLFHFSNMAATDTAVVQTTIGGGTKVVDIFGDGTTPGSFLAIYKVG